MWFEWKIIRLIFLNIIILEAQYKNTILVFSPEIESKILNKILLNSLLNTSPFQDRYIYVNIECLLRSTEVLIRLKITKAAKNPLKTYTDT